jgi:hypothetical protein
VNVEGSNPFARSISTKGFLRETFFGSSLEADFPDWPFKPVYSASLSSLILAGFLVLHVFRRCQLLNRNCASAPDGRRGGSTVFGRSDPASAKSVEGSPIHGEAAVSFRGDGVMKLKHILLALSVVCLAIGTTVNSIYFDVTLPLAAILFGLFMVVKVMETNRRCMTNNWGWFKK